ncbi:MAG TPA: phage holin family protein [Sphingomicrobium sp.]|jgi:hypothetical protein|nr:phage holin family protein [Sphingomicrobium sp.]
MLKPSDDIQPQPERPVGELVHQLVEDGKAYARAELAVAKATATAKGKALAIPAALLLGALIVLQSAITVLALTVFAALLWPLGTILAGLVAFLLFLVIAGGLSWYAVQRVKRTW